MLYPLELHDEKFDKSTGDIIISQDTGHSENESVKHPTRQAAINARHKNKFNELLENNVLTVLFNIIFNFMAIVS